MREARYTVEKVKPIALAHDSAAYLSTYMPLETIRDGECPDELRLPIFDGRKVIPWHRIAWFQRVSLKLLAEQLLLGCKLEADHLGRGLYIPGELARQKVTLRPGLVMFASANNPGALEVANDLASGMEGKFVVTSDPASLRSEDGKKAAATHLLLYLNDQTYVGEAGERLADELRLAREEGSAISVCMVHENDEARGGCTFATFFDGRTPQDLMQDGLYKALAIAMYVEEFWPVSVALVAKEMGATGRAFGGFTTALALRTEGAYLTEGETIWPELVGLPENSPPGKPRPRIRSSLLSKKGADSKMDLLVRSFDF